MFYIFCFSLLFLSEAETSDAVGDIEQDEKGDNEKDDKAANDEIKTTGAVDLEQLEQAMNEKVTEAVKVTHAKDHEQVTGNDKPESSQTTDGSTVANESSKG